MIYITALNNGERKTANARETFLAVIACVLVQIIRLSDLLGNTSAESILTWTLPRNWRSQSLDLSFPDNSPGYLLLGYIVPLNTRHSSTNNTDLNPKFRYGVNFIINNVRSAWARQVSEWVRKGLAFYYAVNLLTATSRQGVRWLWGGYCLASNVSGGRLVKVWASTKGHNGKGWESCLLAGIRKCIDRLQAITCRSKANADTQTENNTGRLLYRLFDVNWTTAAVAGKTHTGCNL